MGSDFPTLKYGSQYTLATIVAQGMLWDLDYLQGDNQADGIFGSQTKAAVMIFQHDNGLEEDGIIGQETWRVLVGKWWCIK
jgi:peptidoglycan hydrolase-like protein with peptidoglycan-binding domain